MKSLNGRDLASFIKERQAHQVASLEIKPKLLIIRDSNNPVITKYVNLKIKYGEDIGVDVEDYLAKNSESIATKIKEANEDPAISGIILQLPILLQPHRSHKRCRWPGHKSQVRFCHRHRHSLASGWLWY